MALGLEYRYYGRASSEEILYEFPGSTVLASTTARNIYLKLEHSTNRIVLFTSSSYKGKVIVLSPSSY